MPNKIFTVQTRVNHTLYKALTDEAKLQNVSLSVIIRARLEAIPEIEAKKNDPYGSSRADKTS